MKQLFFLAIIFIVLVSFKNRQSDELYGLVVVIDPGHGGSDPGANYNFGGSKQCVTESAYCYDIAVRLEKLLKSKGAIVFKTVKTNQIKPIDNNPQKEIVCNSIAVFSFDHSSVQAGVSGLAKRVSFANLKLRNFPEHKVVYISIHFDVIKKELSGARVIYGKNSDIFARCLKNELEIKNRLSNHEYPLIKNGDKSKGVKSIYVLSDKNKIKERVLLELGNFKNEADLWRIRDPKVREDYALIVTSALEKFMKK